MKKHIYNSMVRAAACCAVCASAPVLAQQQVDDLDKQVDFGGALFIEGRYVQNANRTAVEDQQIEEFQSRYGASLYGEIDRELIRLSADYDLYQNDYAEDTQEDQFIRTGRSSLVLGTESTFYQIEAAHSTRRFLFDPAGPAILANTDQRDIASIAPLLRLRPGRSNRFEIMGNFQDVRYKATDVNDSERIGAGVAYMRRMSPVYMLGVRALQNDIDYKNSDEGDYTYRRAGILLESDLRLMNWSIEAGLNEAEPKDGSGDSAVNEIYYDLAIDYGHRRTGWELTAQRAITDTSLGNGNDPFFSEGFTSDVSNRVQDRLERIGYGFAARANIFCALCDVSVRVGYEEENYFTITAENREEIFAGARFQYHLRPTVSLEFIVDHRLRRFAEETPDDQDLVSPDEVPFEGIGTNNGDYADSSAVIALAFSPLVGSLETRLWGEYQQRNPDQGSSYNTNSIGITLGYAF